jgi:hypothetical protein
MKNKITSAPSVGDIKGIKIYMYPDDHGQPHFHAFYSEYEAKYELSPKFEKVAGEMPSVQEAEIRKYVKKHQQELLDTYKQIQNKTWDKKKIVGGTRPSLLAVSADDSFNLWLSYANGEKRQFNIRNFLTSTTNLKNRKDAQEVAIDLKQFKTAKVEGPSVEWANGYDINPDDLYENSTSLKLVATIQMYPAIQAMLT